MTAYSLRARLLALWILLLASAAATAHLLFGFYSQSTSVQVAQAEVAVGGRAARSSIATPRASAGPGAASIGRLSRTRSRRRWPIHPGSRAGSGARRTGR